MVNKERQFLTNYESPVLASLRAEAIPYNNEESAIKSLSKCAAPIQCIRLYKSAINKVKTL